MNRAGHCAGVDWIDYAKGGLKVAVRDTCFCTLGDQVKNGGTGSFRAGSCCCGHCDEREELGGNRKALAEGSVDEVEEVSLCGRSAVHSMSVRQV